MPFLILKNLKHGASFSRRYSLHGTGTRCYNIQDTPKQQLQDLKGTVMLSDSFLESILLDSGIEHEPCHLQNDGFDTELFETSRSVSNARVHQSTYLDVPLPSMAMPFESSVLEVLFRDQSEMAVLDNAPISTDVLENVLVTEKVKDGLVCFPPSFYLAAILCDSMLLHAASICRFVDTPSFLSAVMCSDGSRVSILHCKLVSSGCFSAGRPCRLAVRHSFRGRQPSVDTPRSMSMSICNACCDFLTLILFSSLWLRMLGA